LQIRSREEEKDRSHEPRKEGKIKLVVAAEALARGPAEAAINTVSGGQQKYDFQGPSNGGGRAEEEAEEVNDRRCQSATFTAEIKTTGQIGALSPRKTRMSWKRNCWSHRSL
jgi:hypothetical protein